MSYKTTNDLLQVMPTFEWGNKINNDIIVEFVKLGFLFSKLKDFVDENINNPEYRDNHDDLLLLYDGFSTHYKNCLDIVEYINTTPNEIEQEQTLERLREKHDKMIRYLLEFVNTFKPAKIRRLKKYSDSEYITRALSKLLDVKDIEYYLMVNQEVIDYLQERVNIIVDFSKNYSDSDKSALFVDSIQHSYLMGMLEQTLNHLNKTLQLSFEYFGTRYCFVTRNLQATADILRCEGYTIIFEKPHQNISAANLYNMIVNFNILRNDLSISGVDFIHEESLNFFNHHYYVLKRLLSFKNLFNDDPVNKIMLPNEINLDLIKDEYTKAIEYVHKDVKTICNQDYYFQNDPESPIFINKEGCYLFGQIFCLDTFKDVTVDEIHEHLNDMMLTAIKEDIHDGNVLELCRIIHTFMMQEFNYFTSSKHVVITHFIIKNLVEQESNLIDGKCTFANRKAFSMLPERPAKLLQNDKFKNYTVKEYVHEMFSNIVYPYHNTILREVFSNDIKAMYKDSNFNYFGMLSSKLTNFKITANEKFVSDIWQVDKQKFKVIEGLLPEDEALKFVPCDADQEKYHDQFEDVVIMKKSDVRQLKTLFDEMASVLVAGSTLDAFCDFQEAFEEIMLNNKI